MTTGAPSPRLSILKGNGQGGSNSPDALKIRLDWALHLTGVGEIRRSARVAEPWGVPGSEGVLGPSEVSESPGAAYARR